MRGYEYDYRFRHPYPSRREWRDSGREGRRGYGSEYRSNRAARAQRYAEEYSPAYRQLFGVPFDERYSGTDLGYREILGRTRSPGIGEGSIGGARWLGTGGGFFHR